MDNCPLCGGSTYKLSKRLIKDTCGHSKCRLCLIQEENGCSLCIFQEIYEMPLKIDSIYNLKPANYKCSNCISLQHIINIILKTFVLNNHVSDRIINLQLFKNLAKSNNAVLKYFIQSMNKFLVTDEQKSITEKTNQNQILQMDYKHLNIKFINEAKYFGTYLAHKKKEIHANKGICIKELKQSNNGMHSQHNIFDDMIIININIDNTHYVDNATYEKKMVKYENEDHVQNYQPSQIIILDYLLFDKQNDNSYKKLILTPIHSPDYSSEFRISDYLLFKENAINDKDVIKVTGYNQIESEVHNESKDSSLRNEKISEDHDQNKESKLTFVNKKKSEYNIKEKNNIKPITVKNRKKFHSKTQNKNIEHLVEKSHECTNENINIRRGKRKRKRKMLIYEDEELEVEKKRPIKPRKRNTDWSHIVTLAGIPTKYKCTICEKVFKSIHCKCYHSACLKIGKPPFQCTICNRTFSKRSHFEYHERMHSGDKPFQCNICQKCFIQKNKLNRHLFIHKQHEIECDECGKKFRTKENLKCHLAIHLNNSYACQFCSKTFTLEANRKRHERSHNSERPYKCETCPKSFKDKFLLTRHKRTHGKNKPYSCQNCSRVFLSKFELQRHATVHSDAKPYSCVLCNLKFRRKDNLHRHVKHHHSEDIFDESQSMNVIMEIENGEEMIRNILKSNEPRNKKEQTNLSITPNKVKKRIKKIEKNDDNKSIRSKQRGRPKNVSKSTSSLNIKNSYKLWLQDSSPLRVEDKNEVRVTVPNSQSALGQTTRKNTVRSKLGFTVTIPHKEALNLNRQIEEKMCSQSSFCKFPGFTQTIPLLQNRERQNGNTVSDDIKDKINPEKSKSKCSNRDERNDNEKIDESKCLTNEVYVHWRRRAAESLKPKTSKK